MNSDPLSSPVRLARRFSASFISCILMLASVSTTQASELATSAGAWVANGVRLTVDGNEGLLIATDSKTTPGRASVPVGAEDGGREIEATIRDVSGVVRVYAISGDGRRAHRLGVVKPGRVRFSMSPPAGAGKPVAKAGDWRLHFELSPSASLRIESLQVVARVDDRARHNTILATAYKNGIPVNLPDVLHPLAELTPTERWDTAAGQAVATWARNQPFVQQFGPWLVVRSERMLALFLEVENRVTLENLVDLRSGLRTQSRRSFRDIENIWRVATNGTGEGDAPAGRWGPSSDWRFSATPAPASSTSPHSTLVLSWTPPAESPLRAVRAEVFFNDQTGESEWRIAWEVASTGDLYAIQFPRISGVLPASAKAGKDHLFVPRGHGLVHDNAFATKATYDFSYPSPFMMQFGSYGTPDSAVPGTDGAADGLYWSVHDSEGIIKRISVATHDSGLGFSFTHYADHGSSLSSWRVPYPVLLRPFTGDWFDAAVLYRDWAHRQPWCAQGPMPAGKPNRLLEMDGWLWEANGTHWPTGIINDYLDTFSDFRLVVLNYRWRKDPFDQNYPIYVAADPIGLKKHVDALHARGDLWIPYFNVRAWQRETESWVREDAGAHEIINRGGQPESEFFMGKAQSIMDPSTSFWAETAVDFVRDAQLRYGIKGAYLDQLGASYPQINYRKDADNFGDPAAWTTGQKRLAKRVLSATRADDPDFFTITESCTELFIPERAASILFYIKYLHDFHRWVPAFQAVYHPYDLTVGQPILPIQPQYHYTAAIDLNSGNMPFLNLQNSRTAAGDAVEFFRACMELYRTHKPFLAWGEMMRAPAITCERVDIDWEWRDKRGVAKDQPSVIGSQWRDPAGRRLIIAINHTAAPRVFTLEIDGPPPALTQDVIRHFGLSSKHDNAAGKSLLRGTLPPHEILHFQLNR